MSNDLKLRGGGQAEQASGWHCPSCGKQMPHGSVICIECGYDKRTRRRVTDVAGSGPSLGRLVGIAVALGVVGLGAYLFVTKSNQGGPAPVPEKAVAAPVKKPEAAKPPAPPPPDTVVPVAAEIAAQEAAEAATIEVSPQPEMTPEAREALAKRIDQRFPPYATGETVALRMTNGIIRRGTFQGIETTNVLLAAPGGEVATIPSASLDIASRLRTDPDYRVRYVDYWSKRGLKTAAGP